MKDKFFHFIGVTTVTGLTLIGLLFIWTGLDVSNEDDDTVIIEYTCSVVLKSPTDYPTQVIRECKQKRGMTYYEDKS
jgi:hypothetical protein